VIHSYREIDGKHTVGVWVPMAAMGAKFEPVMEVEGRYQALRLVNYLNGGTGGVPPGGEKRL
jgi:hypothetical protein